MDTGTYDSGNTSKRKSLWEQLLKRFSDAHKVECMAVPLDLPLVHRSVVQFPTGSQYEGTWDTLGMSGQGTYTFPNDVVYIGEFDDGEFHGQGELRYPGGVTLRGRWVRGVMEDTTLVFAEGLEHGGSGWKYCEMPDRRFSIEYKDGIQPAGRSYLTADQPTRDIPPGCYDTGDGFYDPQTKAVYNPDDLNTIIRSTSQLEHKWIIDNCRRNPLPHVGAVPALFEEWPAPTLELEVVQPPPVTSTAPSQRESDAEIEIGRESLIEESEHFVECLDCQQTQTPEQDKEETQIETETETVIDTETIECDECDDYDPTKELSDATLHEAVDTEGIEYDEYTDYSPNKEVTLPVIADPDAPNMVVVICEPCRESD